MFLTEQRGSSRCGSWAGEGKGRGLGDLFGLRQWRHICESCLIEMKVCLTAGMKMRERVLLHPYSLEANLQTFHSEYMEYTEVDALAMRAISSYSARSILYMQLPLVVIIAEANKLAIKYLVSLHTDACCGVSHLASWR